MNDSETSPIEVFQMAVAHSARKFDEGAIFIEKAGNLVGCSCVVIAKALMIYHHFQRVTAEIEFNDLIIGAAVLDTSIYKNTGIDKFKDVVLALLELDTDKDRPSEEVVMLMREDLATVKCIILQTLEYNIDYTVAYLFAERYLILLRSWLETKTIFTDFKELVWMFIGHFYLSKRCLQYPAQEIAFGCITLAAKILFVNLSDFPHWTQEISVHLDNKKEETIIDDLLDELDVLQ